MRLKMQVLLTAFLTFLTLWVSTAKGDTIRLVIFAGQSNIGLSTNSPDRTEFPDILYQYNIAPAAPTEDWIPLQTFGPNNVHASEITFAERTRDALEHERFAIIKFARGGTSLGAHWLPGSDAGIYRESIDFINGAVDQLESQGHIVEPAALIWIHGSGDAHHLSSAEVYDEQLALLIGSFRDDLGAPDLPILFNQYHEDSLRDNTEALRASQARFTSSEANSVMINIDDLELGDSVHWARETHLEAGYRFADAFVDLELARNAAIGIPEPSTLVLTALALLGLLAHGHRRRRA